MTAVAEGALKNTLTHQFRLAGDVELFVFRPAGDNDYIGGKALPAGAGDIARAGKKLNAGYLGSVYLETELLRLRHHLRRQLRAGNAVRKAGVVFNQLDVP